MTISLDETTIQAIRRDDAQAIDNAAFTAVSQDNWSLLHYAAKFGSLEVIKSLIGKNCNATEIIGKCNVKNDDGNRPIHIAADHGYKDIVELFLAKGVKVEEKGKDNWTPLHYAANKGYLDIVQLLVQKKQEVSFVNSETTEQSTRSTPLHYAAANGHFSVVEFLVEFLVDKEAKINIKNSDNKTPLELANEGGHDEVVALLRNELLLAAVKKKDQTVVEAQVALLHS